MDPVPRVACIELTTSGGLSESLRVSHPPHCSFEADSFPHAGSSFWNMGTSSLLPSIPTLPPLSIADSVSPSIVNLKPQSPSTVRASASHDSFATAIDSPSKSDAIPYRDYAAQPNSHRTSVALSQPLRKSLSVDSFVRFSRDGPIPTTSATRSNRSNTTSDLLDASHLYSLDSTGTFDRHVPLSSPHHYHESDPNAHSRRGSAGGRVDDRAADSDALRSDVLSRNSGMARRLSMKGKDPRRPSLRGGELALPSRSQALSSAGSSSFREENTQRLRSISSAQFPSSRPDVAISSLSGRPRSGSLGMQVNSNGRHIVINTDVSNVSRAFFFFAFHNRAGGGKVQRTQTQVRNRSCSGWHLGMRQILRHTKRSQTLRAQ